MANKKYFHEVEQEEIDNLVKDKRTVNYVLENYKQPDWCKYPEALSMEMGCWSLCDFAADGLRTQISKYFCSTCDSYKKTKKKYNIMTSEIKNKIINKVIDFLETNPSNSDMRLASALIEELKLLKEPHIKGLSNIDKGNEYDEQYLYNAYNATSTDIDGDLETYEAWLERQLISRLKKIDELEQPNPLDAFPTRNVCFFSLKDGKYLTENGVEITTEMIVKYPHQITDAFSYIILD